MRRQPQPYLEESTDTVFGNTFRDIEYFVGLTNENDIKPEIEIYDLGML